MYDSGFFHRFLKLPKGELHLHLEGSIEPETLVELAARHGEKLAPEEVVRRHQYRDFTGFIEAFKWVTAYLRRPEDYGLITERLAERLDEQGVVYAELTFALGIMLWRKQDAEANFQHMCDAAERARRQGLRIQWIPDCVRQFGAAAAMEVARLAARMKAGGAIAFGMGGDEPSLPAAEFRGVYEFVAAQGLRRYIHAGETGGPQEVREAVEILGAERIAHGIGAIHDEATMEMLGNRGITLDVCPTSNLRTGALAKQLGRADARLEEHPLPQLVRAGVRVTLSTDDPAMFHTRLTDEYAACAGMGVTPQELVNIAEEGFEAAFLPDAEKAEYRALFRNAAQQQGLLY